MTNYYIKLFAGAVLMIALMTSVQAKGYDWNHWKGPDQNGISQETDWDPMAINKPLKINWKINIGPGYSTVATQGDKVYTIGYDEKRKKNILYCLNTKNGKTVWKYRYKAVKGRYAGPKCTPVIDGDRVYTISQDGLLFCNHARTGKVIWKQDVVNKYGATMLKWRLSASVLIEGDLAIINANQAGLAVNKKTGKLVWKSKPGKGNYSTPVSFKIGDETLIAIHGKKQFSIVNALTGVSKDSYYWETRRNIFATDPSVIGNHIFISSGYGEGSALLTYTNGQLEEVWKHDQLSVHFSTVIILEDMIYAVHGNAGTDAKLKCVRFKDGKEMWSQSLGFGNMMAANGYLLFLSEQGSFYVIKADPNKYQLISSQENVISGTCWTAPVLSHGQLYLRNDSGDLISLDVAKK